MPFKLTILGSGAAVPTGDRTVTSQFLNFNERRILIDCGEGTQLQLRKRRKKIQRINYVFISHAHADHILGLPGLIATMSLLGRENELQIFCPPVVKQLLDFQLNILGVQLAFPLKFILLESNTKTLIFEDKVLNIYAFPLNHRVPCFGFLFEEKPKERNIIPEKIEHYKLSIPEILQLKKGETVNRNEEEITPEECTNPPEKPISYAFCTDTRPVTELKKWCSDVDLMYHEATFVHEQIDRAKKTHHSTAREAAELANLVGVKHLLLGHFSARFTDTDSLQEEAEQYHSKVSCVEDGDAFLL